MNKVRIFSNVCIYRYEQGEGAVLDILDSYTALTQEEKQQIYNYIVSIYPEVQK